MKLEVFVPTGSGRDSNKFPYAPRLPNLNGKTIGEISNRLWEADRIFPRIREVLTQLYPDIKFVPYTEFPHHADDIQGEWSFLENMVWIVQGFPQIIESRCWNSILFDQVNDFRDADRRNLNRTSGRRSLIDEIFRDR